MTGTHEIFPQLADVVIKIVSDQSTGGHSSIRDPTASDALREKSDPTSSSHSLHRSFFSLCNHFSTIGARESQLIIISTTPSFSEHSGPPIRFPSRLPCPGTHWGPRRRSHGRNSQFTTRRRHRTDFSSRHFDTETTHHPPPPAPTDPIRSVVDTNHQSQPTRTRQRALVDRTANRQAGVDIVSRAALPAVGAHTSSRRGSVPIARQDG